MIDLDRTLLELKQEWNRDSGFLGKLRMGSFDRIGYQRFKALISEIHINEDDTLINRRLVTLLWTIPLYMRWQSERVEKNGMDPLEYTKRYNELQDIIYHILGAP